MTMSVKVFDNLTKRDLENGAILNEIRDSIKELERINEHITKKQHKTQPPVQADTQHCGNCGAELKTYCKKCFNSSAVERTD